MLFTSRVIMSGQVRKCKKKLVKRFEEPGFPSTVAWRKRVGYDAMLKRMLGNQFQLLPPATVLRLGVIFCDNG